MQAVDLVGEVDKKTNSFGWSPFCPQGPRRPEM